MTLKKIAAMAMTFFVSLTFVSCGDDSRTGIQGYDDCILCHGKGYCEKTEMFGLQTSYWDCSFCKSRSSRYIQDGYNPSFRGSAKGSCNIPSHHCAGYYDDGNRNCVNCAANGYTCHAVNHQ